MSQPKPSATERLQAQVELARARAEADAAFDTPVMRTLVEQVNWEAQARGWDEQLTAAALVARIESLPQDERAAIDNALRRLEVSRLVIKVALEKGYWRLA